jgi:cytochrome c
VGRSADPFLRVLVPLLSLLPSTALALDGDAARGERVFQRCYACHSVDPGEKAKLQGPSLFAILDRPAAAIADFDYSDAMREKGATGLVWDAATLDRYIADPDSVMPGTRMSVPPLRDEQERADLVAYLARSGVHRR